MISRSRLYKFLVLAVFGVTLSVGAQVAPPGQVNPGVTTMPGGSLAAGATADPADVAEAVNDYIATLSSGGAILIYDRGGQGQLRLTHKSTDDTLTRKLMGGSYVTTALFEDGDGASYEVDFLIGMPGPDQLEVIPAGTYVRVSNGKASYEWMKHTSRDTYYRSDEASRKLASDAPPGEVEEEVMEEKAVADESVFKAAIEEAIAEDALLAEAVREEDVIVEEVVDEAVPAEEPSGDDL